MLAVQYLQNNLFVNLSVEQDSKLFTKNSSWLHIFKWNMTSIYLQKENSYLINNSEHDYKLFAKNPPFYEFLCETVCINAYLVMS